jgi:hypothetical protein
MIGGGKLNKNLYGKNLDLIRFSTVIATDSRLDVR